MAAVFFFYVADRCECGVIMDSAAVFLLPRRVILSLLLAAFIGVRPFRVWIKMSG